MAKQVKVTYRIYGLPDPEPGSVHPQGGEWWLFSGMGTGLDGTIYSGLCDERFIFRGARLIAYYPERDAMRTLADMNTVCGHDGRPDLCGQTKMHTRIMPDSDGRMYFGMHSAERDYAPPELLAKLTGGYPGGHWICYDPQADLTRDLGIAIPGESLMGFTIDPRTHRLYATTHTKNLMVEYDIATGRNELIGSCGKFPTREMERTEDGLIYTWDDEGRVLRFDPQTRELRTLDAQLPGFEGDVNHVTTFATTVGLDGHTIYGVSTAFRSEPREPMGVLVEGKTSDFRPGYCFAYDTQDGPDGKMRTIGTSGGSGEDSSTQVGDMALHHSITRTRAGDVLYVSPRGLEPAHLVMIDTGRMQNVGKEQVRDLGEMVGEGDEGFVETAFAAATGLDGTVYFGGPRKSEKHPRDNTRWAMIVLPEDSWL